MIKKNTSTKKISKRRKPEINNKDILRKTYQENKQIKQNKAKQNMKQETTKNDEKSRKKKS